MSHKCVNCALACLEINDTGLSWSIQTSHIVPQSNRNQPNDASWMRPHTGTLWHISEDMIFCKNKKYFVQSHIKKVLQDKAFIQSCIECGN